MKNLLKFVLQVFCTFLGFYARFLFLLGNDTRQVQAKVQKISFPAAYLTRQILGFRS